MAGVLTMAKDSPLLATLLRAVPQIRERCKELDAWSGIKVAEPELDEEYLRLVCKDELVAPPRTGEPGAIERMYRPAIHLFAQTGYEGRLHDHRWPIAVLPFDLEGRARATLYEMPWEVRRDGEVVDRGRLVVRSGAPWAIEACSEVFHGVKSLRPHLSIVIADTTEPARRENRMTVAPMTADEVAAVLDRARDVIRV